MAFNIRRLARILKPTQKRAELPEEQILQAVAYTVAEAYNAGIGLYSLTMADVEAAITSPEDPIDAQLGHILAHKYRQAVEASIKGRCAA